MSSHNPTHPHARETDTGTTWLSDRPAWTAGPRLQTEHVDYGGAQFWIAYPLTTVRMTLAQRILAATGQGATVGEALRMAALA